MLGVKEFTDLKQKVYLEGAYSYIDTLLFTYLGGGEVFRLFNFSR